MEVMRIMVTGESDERDGKGFDRDGTTRLKKKAAPYFEWKDKTKTNDLNIFLLK